MVKFALVHFACCLLIAFKSVHVLQINSLHKECLQSTLKTGD